MLDLVKPVEEVELSTGRVVLLRGISGAAYELRAALQEAGRNPESGAATDEDVWKYGEALMPDVPPDEIRRLSAQEIAVIGEIACGHLDAVLKMAEERSGNSVGAVATASPSAPATGSRRPASRSAKRSARGRARS